MSRKFASNLLITSEEIINAETKQLAGSHWSVQLWRLSAANIKPNSQFLIIEIKLLNNISLKLEMIQFVIFTSAVKCFWCHGCFSFFLNSVSLITLIAHLSF